MEKIIYPQKNAWPLLWKRPQQETLTSGRIVEQIFDEVIANGDAAVLKYTRLYDCPGASPVEPYLFKEEDLSVPRQLSQAIDLAASNIRLFHSQQIEKSEKIEVMAGVTCWRESRAIEKVGIYIPGGSAPLFSSVLMLAIPARIAGCKEVIICTPPDENGAIHPAILYAARVTGITQVFAVGGVQAIAAMAVGTNTIPRVDKIFGPGNQYVTAAKLYAQQLGIAIDLPAGPSEVLVIADKGANPAFLAADILSQAEHGEDSQTVLLSNEERIIDQTLEELKSQLQCLPRKKIAGNALMNSKAILLENLAACVDFSNGYAPEHLIIATENAREVVPLVANAGSVFLGRYSCESAGDYASGTNHTLPTNGYAKSYSGVSLDSFVKKITFQELTAEGIAAIGPAIESMAEAEGLHGHKQAVTIRLSSLKQLENIK